MALGTMAAAASIACEEGEDVGEVHALRHVLDLRTDVRQGAGELALERRLRQPDAVLVSPGLGFLLHINCLRHELCSQHYVSIH